LGRIGIVIRSSFLLRIPHPDSCYKS
jgi:hypothetical protein